MVQVPDVHGRVVVITGASRGLGRGMAGTMAGLGCKLGLCARSPIDLGDVGEDAVVKQQLDVTDESALQAFADAVVKTHGAIDLWINNAGVLDPVAFVRDLPSAELMNHLSINVAGVLHGTRVFARHLRDANREGTLINISSGAALKGYAGWGAYCAGKAAVDRLSECVALEEPLMRCFAVAPGVVDTDMQAIIRDKTPEEFPMVQKFLDLKTNDAFNSPGFVARHLLRLGFDPEAAPDSVVVRLPNEG